MVLIPPKKKSHIASIANITNKTMLQKSLFAVISFAILPPYYFLFYDNKIDTKAALFRAYL